VTLAVSPLLCNPYSPPFQVVSAASVMNVAWYMRTDTKAAAHFSCEVIQSPLKLFKKLIGIKETLTGPLLMEKYPAISLF